MSVELYGNCTLKDNTGGTSYVLAANSYIDDCGLGGGGDSLVYYCCDGIPRYCLSGESDCYWENYGCLSQYLSINCHSPVQWSGYTDNSNRFAYTTSLDPNIYWFCNNYTEIFCATTVNDDSNCTYQLPDSSTPNPTQIPTISPTNLQC